MPKIYKGISPCKDCTTRSATCRIFCSKYKKWKESGVEIKKEIFRGRQIQ